MLALCVEGEKTEIKVHDDVESGAWNVMMHLNGMCWGVNFIVCIEGRKNVRKVHEVLFSFFSSQYNKRQIRGA